MREEKDRDDDEYPGKRRAGRLSAARYRYQRLVPLESQFWRIEAERRIWKIKELIGMANACMFRAALGCAVCTHDPLDVHSFCELAFLSGEKKSIKRHTPADL